MGSINDRESAPDAIRLFSRPGELQEDWQAARVPAAPASRAATRHDASPPASRGIGQPVDGNTRELIVSCDPGPALRQQFDHAQPEFIALHDVGEASSRKLLAAIAAAMGQAVGKLLIRRQGYGTTLATLEFIEFPGADSGDLRLYSTDVQADAAARTELARVLLSCSRLGVLMVGDLASQALAAAIGPLREHIVVGPWSNRDLLMLPAASSATLASLGGDLGRGTGVTVRTTPPVVRPADAWNFISGTWNRLRTQIEATGKRVPALPQTPQRPAPESRAAAPAPAAAMFGPYAVTPSFEQLSLKPMPAAAQKAPPTPSAIAGLMTRYVEQLRQLSGMLDCSVFEASTGRSIAHAGSSSDPQLLASAGVALMASVARAGLRLGLKADLPEAAITLDTRHLFLRPVPRHPKLMLQAVLDKSQANMTAVRLQILRLDDLFDPPAS